VRRFIAALEVSIRVKAAVRCGDPGEKRR